MALWLSLIKLIIIHHQLYLPALLRAPVSLHATRLHSPPSTCCCIIVDAAVAVDVEGTAAPAASMSLIFAHLNDNNFFWLWGDIWHEGESWCKPSKKCDWARQVSLYKNVSNISQLAPHMPDLAMCNFGLQFGRLKCFLVFPLISSSCSTLNFCDLHSLLMESKVNCYEM